MARATYTVDVRFHGVWQHRHRGRVVAYSFGHENVIRLLFEDA
jgi:hypothetical protein